MALRIDWTESAETTFNHIIEYLAHRWGDKAVKVFLNRTNNVLQLISENPTLYRKSKKKNIHEAVVTKHNTLFYKIKKENVELLTFWDNRQVPNKLKV